MSHIKKFLIVICFIMISTLLSGCIALVGSLFDNMERVVNGYNAVSETIVLTDNSLEEEQRLNTTESVTVNSDNEVMETTILPYFTSDELCYAGEVYHEKDNICTLPVTCLTIEECSLWGDQVVREINVHYDGFEYFYGFLDYYYDAEMYDLTETNDTSLEEQSWFNTFINNLSEDNNYDEEIIVTFQLDNFELVKTVENEVDANIYEWYWDEFKWIIPTEQLWMLDSFSIFTDEELLAYVIETNTDLTTWNLAINETTNISYQDSISTHVHEFAHLLFLNSKQLNPHKSLWSCDSDVYMEDRGCAVTDSYVYQFVEQFGVDYDQEYDPELFVSDYAANNLMEDMAESFYMFVLTEKPDSHTVADEKVLFFYNYEELVYVRAEILSRVATYMYRVL